MYASAANISADGNAETLPVELSPISVEEKKELLASFQKDMDPEATIYACASCGVWVTIPKLQAPYKRTLAALKILELSLVQTGKYLFTNENDVDQGILKRKVTGVTACLNGKYYYLYRNWLRGCEFECTFENVLEEVSDDTEALLCESCYSCTKPSSKRVPPMSLSAGVDYGLAWKFLPELSFLEKLLLQSFTVFGHLFKATSASGVSIKGALIALRTDAKEIMLQRKKLEEDRCNNIPVLIPRRTINMDIQFLGKLHIWNRIKSEPTARLDFISMHKKVFRVSSENLAI